MLHNFNAQNVANMLWAWSKLDANPGVDALHALSRDLLRKISSFLPQNLVNTIYAYAKLFTGPWAAELAPPELAEERKTVTPNPTELLSRKSGPLFRPPHQFQPPQI